jgi:hypothetical protein
MKKLFPISVLLVAAGLLFPLRAQGMSGRAQSPAPITTCMLPSAVADHLCVIMVNEGGFNQIAAQIWAITTVGAGVVSAATEAEINAIRNQQNVDEAKEAADVAMLQTSIQSAFQAALAKDANSLETCQTGETCSFTIAASDISGQFKADLINGPSQPSADATFTRKAGYLQPGEELYYTQYVPLAGLYTFSAAVASVATTSCPATQTGSFHLEIAGKRAFPVDGSSVPVPRTATWSSYQTLMPGQVQLPGGVVKFAFVNDSAVPSCFDLLWLGFAK